MIFLSFIIPLYNQQDYIVPCLYSITDAGLSNEDYEVIVQNDGSTDHSEEFASGYIHNRPNFRLINNSNHGVSYSRNQALQEANGDYVRFVESDDMETVPK